MQTIMLGGQEFPIRFDINVVQKIQEKYGNVNLLDSKLRDFDEMKWVMSLLISEGLEYEAFALQRPARKVSPEQVGTLLTIKDFLSGSISQKVIDAFNESLGDEKKLDSRGFDDASEFDADGSEEEIISFPRLSFFGRVLLRYSAREYGYLTIRELTEQIEQYTEFYGKRNNEIEE